MCNVLAVKTASYDESDTGQSSKSTLISIGFLTLDNFESSIHYWIAK